MKAIYSPPADAGEDAKITLGLGEKSDKTLVLRRGEPVKVPPAFEDAVRAHDEIEVVK